MPVENAIPELRAAPHRHRELDDDPLVAAAREARYRDVPNEFYPISS